jgi:anti-anti-sigma factor
MAESEASENSPSVFASSVSGAVTLRTQGRAAILEVTGALDLALAPKLRELAEHAVESNPDVLVLDLTPLRFLASVGMAELVRAHRALGDGAVRVVVNAPVVRRPLELTRLADELNLYPTLSAALDGR